MRVGSLIKLKPEWEERYIILHRHTFPGVLDRIRRSNIRNYSIFLHGGMLFSYWEYIGNDYDGDMADIGRDKVTQDWWKLTDPMQEPLTTRKDGERWASLEELFHWSANSGSREKNLRVALTARIPEKSGDRLVDSLKIAYPILVETIDLKDLKNISVFHKDGCLYSYVEFLDKDLKKGSVPGLLDSLKVEDELDWCSMDQVFHLD